MNRKSLFQGTVLQTLGVLVMLSGCQPVITQPSSFELLLAQSASPAGAAYNTPVAYHIGVGDELEVKFLASPEFNDLQQVRPDGKISLMFAQDVDAAGLTPDALAAILKQKLSKHMPQADLVVVMRTFASQKVFVGGEVSKPGPVQLAGNENITQVLNEAGWVTPASRLDEVALIRRDADGKESVYPINVDKVLKGEDMSQNIMVQAGDIVLVPPSDAVAFDRWVDRNIRQALPVTLGASYVQSNQTNNSILH